jgi:enoyl-CoA hydratase/carnithine racemase
MFTTYATSGGGMIAWPEPTNATAINEKTQRHTEANARPRATAQLPSAEIAPYWYELGPTTTVPRAPRASAKRAPQAARPEPRNSSIPEANRPIIGERSGATALITLNRPAVLNALDMQMITLLRARLHEAGQDPSVRAIIITGQGVGFCAGGDLKFAQTLNPDQPGDSFLALTAVLHATIAEIRAMPKPVIAAINGPAAGAGLFLALACDLRVMAQGAYLKQSNTSYGLSIPAGGTFLLPRLVGLSRALEIAMLDKPIFAASALELGLVTQVVPEAMLLTEAQQLADRVARRAGDAIGRTKALLNSAFYHTLEEHLQLERQAIAATANSAEGREGLAAFLEKRQPAFNQTRSAQ